MGDAVLSLEYVLNLQERIYNLVHAAGKRMFGRMVDKFSFTDNSRNSGMDFGSLMTKRPYIGMNFRSLTPKWRKQLTAREKIFQKNGALLLEDKLKGIVSVVHKGVLPGDCVVAIKRCKTSDEEQVEPFINEIVILGQINHRNVVQLLGCCLENEVPFLVYEFVSSYNLNHYIHHNKTKSKRFSWDNRLRIAYESAGALAYLHSDSQAQQQPSYIEM